MMVGCAAQVGQIIVAAAGSRAFEGIEGGWLAAQVATPGGVEVIHFDGHPVGVRIARTEDDGLLLGAAGSQEQVEQVGAHGLHPVRQ